MDDVPPSSSKPPRLPLADRVGRWLENTGYPLEYQASQILSREGFMVGHGFFLPGDHDRNSLELDVVCLRRNSVADFILLVECKVVPSNQVWVALGPRTDDPWSSSGIARCSNAQDFERRYPSKFIGLDPKRSTKRAVQLKTMFEGNSSAERKNKNEDDKNAGDPGYRAIQNLVGKTIASIDTGTDDGSKRLTDKDRSSIVVPLLVVSGELATALWSPDESRFQIEPTHHVWLDWSGHAKWPLQTASLAVATLDHLPQLAVELREWADRWTAAVESAHNEDLAKAFLLASTSRPKR